MESESGPFAGRFSGEGTMKEIFVRLSPAGEGFSAPAGQCLLDALRKHGVFLDAPCGGKGRCGKCRVSVNGRETLACQTVLTEDVQVSLPERLSLRILEGSGDADADGAHRYVLAFDVGTTTVVAFLSEGRTGRQLACASAINPQSAYGADVIARIQYELEHRDGTMASEIRSCLSRLALEAAEAAGISAQEIDLAALVGNTAMHHLLLGLDVAPLVKPPYMPQVREALELSAPWLPVAPGAVLRVLPNIAGFVGGDTVGCLVFAGFDRIEALTLLIDIGTNGEMVLGDRRRRMACSTAAGPAFEGAKIQFGMRGAPGAIDHVSLGPDGLECHVIGEGTAKGICGSGLLDGVYAMLRAGFLDGSGRMCPEVPGPWLRVEGQPAFLLRDGIYLTQKDIRELQLAKAAIRAGIELLLEAMGREKTEICRVLLAGAFGSYLSPESACGLGMLPPELGNRIHAIGNAAGEGAKHCALQRENFRRSIALAEETEFLELASLPAFQDCFVDCLSFAEDWP